VKDGAAAATVGAAVTVREAVTVGAAAAVGAAVDVGNPTDIRAELSLLPYPADRSLRSHRSLIQIVYKQALQRLKT
jgi:hypothetical protein